MAAGAAACPVVGQAVEAVAMRWIIRLEITPRGLALVLAAGVCLWLWWWIIARWRAGRRGR